MKLTNVDKTGVICVTILVVFVIGLVGFKLGQMFPY